jgi:hypothetical protein
MNRKQYLRRKKKLINRIFRRIYIDRERDIHKSTLIAGAGRSGTTWLADILSSQLPSRIMFEPFHAEEIEECSRFHYFQYMRPAQQYPELLAYCQKVLSGNIRHPWIDRQVYHLLPRYRVIKDIRVTLFLKWFSERFIDVPVLFVARHPCAVVLSRMEYNWDTEQDIRSFLAQPELIEDFLRDKLDIIENTKTIEGRHAIIWCVSNLVPLTQFQPADLNIFYYEHLCVQPDVEIPRMFHVMGKKYSRSVFRQLEQPSITSLASSAIMTGEDKVARWKSKLSAAQIDNIMSVVKAFGLDHLYGDSVMPMKTEYLIGEA